MAESTSNRMFSQQYYKACVVIMDILKFDGTTQSFVVIEKQRSILHFLVTDRSASMTFPRNTMLTIFCGVLLLFPCKMNELHVSCTIQDAKHVFREQCCQVLRRCLFDEHHCCLQDEI